MEWRRWGVRVMYKKALACFFSSSLRYRSFAFSEVTLASLIDSSMIFIFCFLPHSFTPVVRCGAVRCGGEGRGMGRGRGKRCRERYKQIG